MTWSRHVYYGGTGDSDQNYELIVQAVVYLLWKPAV